MLYPDSEHITVWKYAKENRYTLVSKDSDFNDICRVSVAQDTDLLNKEVAEI